MAAMDPPAFSIAALAPLEAAMPDTVKALSTLPARMILARFASAATSPAFFSPSRSIAPAPAFARSPERTSAAFVIVVARKPRLGRRRCSGICPPSKPTLWKPPARAFWPLWPRPAVLPRPEPPPRPTRRRFFFEPAAGLIVFSSIVLFLDLHQVAHPVDHSADGRGVRHLHAVLAVAQPQALHRFAVLVDRAAQPLHQGHFEFLAGRGRLLALCAHLASLSGDLFDLLAALGRDLGRAALLRQAVQRGAHDVVRIGGAVALGGDVGDTHHLEHRAHGAPGLDAVAFLRGLHHHARGPVAAEHLVVDGPALQRDLHHVAARLLHRLLHRDRHFARLALAQPDRAVAVAHHGERREAEDASALHHLGDSVHRDHLLAQAVAALVGSHALAVHSCHVLDPLELEAARAGGLGQRLDAAVIAETGAVEGHFRDSRRLGFLRDALAHFGGRFLLGAVRMRRAHVLLERRGRGEHPAAGGVDHLRVDVQVGAVHREARRVLANDAHARLCCAADSRCSLVHVSALPQELSGNWLSAPKNASLLVEGGNLLSAPTIAPVFHLSRSHLFLLRFLERHLLARVAHALALVRLL